MDANRRVAKHKTWRACLCVCVHSLSECRIWKSGGVGDGGGEMEGKEEEQSFDVFHMQVLPRTARQFSLQAVGFTSPPHRLTTTPVAAPQVNTGEAGDKHLAE